ncbi:TonB-dependent siderophore receptor [Pseudomonas ovata]|uniref:TonB-dependent siderophore receptor n=1 Tax=Pseudomonas ovata TaxID=1839709 RepID=UPI001F4F0E1F|nr:TonB-dependent siderophore receptor [Pseudomonas ovata]
MPSLHELKPLTRALINHRTFRFSSLPAMGLALAMTCMQVQAQEWTLNIPAQPLDQALQTLASQIDMQILYGPSDIQGLSSPTLKGNFSAEESIQALLVGTGIAYQVNGNTITLQARPNEALELSSVNISGKAPGSTTEGTGLYTTYSASSATRLNLPPKETPQSVTVLTRQRLDDQRIENVIDALDATAGITVSHAGVDIDNDLLYSRGFILNNYAIDGVRTSSSLANQRLSAVTYDRIEIVRGATGLISGMGTPSATINLIRKRPTFDPQISFTAEAGSWDRYGSGFDVSGPLNDAGTVRGRLVADYKTQHAWIDRYEKEESVLYGISEFDLSENTLLTLGFNFQTSDTNSPMRSGYLMYYGNNQRIDFKRSANNAPDWAYYDNELSGVFSSIEHQFDSGWSGKIEYRYNQYRNSAVVPYMGGTVNQATGAGAYIAPARFRGDPKEHTLDLYATGPFTVFNREHELITGATLSDLTEDTPAYGSWMYPYTGYNGSIPNLLDWDGSLNKPDFPKTADIDMHEYQYGAYLSARFHLTDSTSLIVGNRVTDWKRNRDSTNLSGVTSKTSHRESGVYIPYAGIVQDLDDTWSLYASYTKIFNPQPVYVRDVNRAPLAPEEGSSYEIGAKASFYDGRLTSNLALFKTEQDNLAVLIDDGTFSNYTSEQGTSSRGVELELNGELADGWQLTSGYTYSVIEDSEGERIVTQVPRHSVKTFTTYRLPGMLDKMTVGGGINWQSKTGTDLKYFTQGSYALVNLMARYQINEHLTASVNLNNLFDKEYFAGGPRCCGVYGEPRNFMTSFKYTY